MEKYAKYREMMEFLQRVDDIYDYYITKVEPEFLDDIRKEENLEKLEEKFDLVGKVFDNFEELKTNLNDVAFEIVESK